MQITGALSINNGAATPVAKNFAPESVAPGKSVFAERSAVSSNGFTRITVTSDFANSRRPTNRIGVDIAMPIIENVSGQNTVTRTLRASVQFVIPDSATDAERKDLHAFLVNALSNAAVKAVPTALDPMY